jgi:hypothetical protein
VLDGIEGRWFKSGAAHHVFAVPKHSRVLLSLARQTDMLP